MSKLKVLAATIAASALVLGVMLTAPGFSLAKNGSDDNSNSVNSNQNVNDSNSNVNSDHHSKPEVENGDDNGNDIDDQDGLVKEACTNGLANGHLYKVGTDATVYMSSHCTLKPFRGEAVFKTRGLKFKNITTFDTLPTGVTISSAPMLPADGTLVKGHDKTVWFVDNNGHRRGFVSESVFKNLGFSFEKVNEISDSDLSQIPTDTNVETGDHHPDGSLIKCQGTGQIDIVIGNQKHPFANAAAFESRGHSFEHILIVDCSKFKYADGTVISQ